MAAPLVSITDRGTMRRAELALSAIPKATDTARRSALAKLKNFVQSQVAKVVSAELKIPQKTIKALGRVHGVLKSQGEEMSIWIGTKDIPVRYLGTIKWTREMPGAKVGKTTFPGSWSWSHGKTAGRVKRRTSHYLDASYIATGPKGSGQMRKRWGAGYAITEVTVQIHDTVSQRIADLLPAVSKRYGRLMRQELNYALRKVAQ